MLSIEDFGQEMSMLLYGAASLGLVAVEINAGSFHRRVGGYIEGGQHAMRSCCDALRPAIRPTDEVVEEPPKGKGASFTVRYHLPRTERKE